MSNDNAPFDIHLHGDVPLRSQVSLTQLQDALKPLWRYAGARSLAEGAQSCYEEEPGIRFDERTHVLQICWTVQGDHDIRPALDEVCMALNELTARGGMIEVSFVDAEFDEEDEDSSREPRDDYYMLFVGPTPAAIMQLQRDLLVEDVLAVIERHFDAAEANDVVHAIDHMFESRMANLMNSLDVSRIVRGPGPGSGGQGGGRKPRHLH